MKSIPSFSLTDIKKDLDPNYFARGADYQKEKRVTGKLNLPFKVLKKTPITQTLLLLLRTEPLGLTDIARALWIIIANTLQPL